MNSLWLSFIPHYVSQEIISNPDSYRLGEPHNQTVVALFADVSGFTAMSEALAKIGKAGTEELTTSLNSYFSAMIELIQSYGGMIGKFGGDAMTVIFPYEPDTVKSVVQRATYCAISMQSQMGKYASIPTSAGNFRLAMKAGLAMGPILTTTVGDPKIRIEHILAGKVFDLCAEAEHHATQGEVVIHQALLPYLSEPHITEKRSDFLVIDSLKEHISPKPLDTTSEPPTDEALDLIRSFLHPTIAQRIATGQGSFISDHRRVTVLFVNIDGLDFENDSTIAQTLQDYFEHVVQIIERFDGYLNKIDMGDKGSKYIVVFGAPVAHEHDEERALRCALELQAIPTMSIRIGINTGLAFCGQVGSSSRQEYTVMGDPVNLSARLMQAAKLGQIWVSSSTQSYAQDHFIWETLPSISVKGKTEAVEIYRLKGIQDESTTYLHEQTFSLPMVGRERELAIADDIMQHTLSGKGQILGIVAEAGMGKSRLNAEIGKIADSKNFFLLGGECEPHGTQSSYLVWQAIWRRFFGIRAGDAVQTQINQVTTQLQAIDESLVQRLPILGMVLNLSIPENRLTLSLDPELRTSLLKSLLLKCLETRSISQPLFIVLEDCHWIDPLSLELLEFLGNNLHHLPVMIVVAYRPGDQFHNPMKLIAKSELYTELGLTEFAPEEARQLIGLKLESLFETTVDLPQALVGLLSDNAQGNPFYIEEIINYVHDQNLSFEEFIGLEKLDIPDSLQSLILSRIDQLDEGEQITIKVASVIGRLFKERWIHGAYPEIGNANVVQKYLQNLNRLDIALLERRLPEREYLFKHSTTREVAYDSLTFSLRRMLHERVADFFEKTYSQEIDNYVDVLAHHYAQTENYTKQRHYFRLAGLRAKAAYANQSAIDYFTRLLPIMDGTDKIEILLELGAIYQLIGNWDDAETVFQEASAIATNLGNHDSAAKADIALGYLLVFQQKFDEAKALIESAKDHFEANKDREGLGQSLEYLGFLYQEQQHYEDAMQMAEAQLAMAIADDNPRGICEAMRIKGNVHLYLGDFEEALTCYERQIAIAHEIDNRRETIYALGNMAGVYMFQGNYPLAMDCCIRSIKAAKDIGYLHAEGVVYGNAAEIYRYQGEYEQSLACSHQAMIILVRLRDFVGIANVLANIATAEFALSNFDFATLLYQKSIALGRVLEIPYLLSEFLYNYSLLVLENNDINRAEKLIQEALPMAEEAGNQDVYFKAQLLKVRLAVLAGTLKLKKGISTLLAMLDEHGENPEELAHIYFTIWEIDHQQKDFGDKAAEIYADLYQRTPNIIYFNRYEEITDTRLPYPTELPQLIPNWVADMDQFATLLTTVDYYLESQN